MIKHNTQKRLLVLLLVALFFVSPYFLVFSPTKADTAFVVHWISVPSVQGKPQGLAWDGQYLWGSTTGGGWRGLGNSIYKLNPSTGEVVFFSYGGYTGLAWDGQHLWAANDASDKIYRGFHSGRLGFDSPGNSPRGLAWDGHYLWNADVDDDKIYKLNASTGEVVASFDSPGDSPIGLAWDGHYLWNADFKENTIYKLNPSTGEVVASINSPGDSPRGLAWDGEYLWNVDSGVRKIFKLRVLKPSLETIVVAIAVVILVPVVIVVSYRLARYKPNE